MQNQLKFFFHRYLQTIKQKQNDFLFNQMYITCLKSKKKRGKENEILENNVKLKIE